VTQRVTHTRKHTRGSDGGRFRKYQRAYRRRSLSSLTINLAPMIDVTFLLLIFFSVTTTFKRAEGYLAAELPRTAGRSSVELPISPIVVRVQQFGMGTADYRIRVDNFANAPATFDELANMLRGIQGNPGFDTDTPVVIAAEDDVAWDHVVNAWNAALRAEYKNIAFGAN